MESDEQSDDELDPRVQDELESLNRATDDINRWENEISIERDKFKVLLNSAIQQLTSRGKKLEKSIERARPYYETMKDVKQAQAALERAVQNFQKSNGIHRAAKETISLAEQRLSEFSDPKVDGAWQEMLNIQTMRFMEAEKDRARSEKIHKQAALKHEYLQKKANKLKQKHKNSTAKTQSYYETKEKLEAELQKQQQRVAELQDLIKNAKSSYQRALANLEKISSEIHQQRKVAQLQLSLPDRAVAEGSESPDSENLAAIAQLNNFDLKQKKVYDDVDDLEAELDDFEFDDYSSEEDDLSSNDEWSGPGESSESTMQRDYRATMSSHLGDRQASMGSSKELRHNSARAMRRQISSGSIDEPLRPNKAQRRSKKFRKKVSPPRDGCLVEEVSEERTHSVTSSNVTNKQCTTPNDVTYDNLHGTSAATIGNDVTNTSPDYDIFDDLC